MSNKENKSVITSRYIVPFLFDADKVTLKAEDGWSVAGKQRQENDVYDYIFDSITESKTEKEEIIEFKLAENKIAGSYTYNRKQTFWFERLDPQGELDKKVVSKSVKTTNAGLTLFKDNVGFFWYEIELNDSFGDVSAWIDFTSVFKELARNKGPVSREDKTTDKVNDDVKVREYNDEKKETKITVFKNKTPVGLWICDVLDTLGCEITYLPQRVHDGKQIPDKAIMFHHAIFYDAFEVVKYAYRLTRGYNQNYRICEDRENEMLRPFDNVWIFATGEGCGYYTYKSDVNVQTKKIMTDYFTLYLMALHQSYALLHFSTKLADLLPATSDSYLGFSKDTYQKLLKLNTENDTFLAKSIYSSVSFVQHQNDYYKYLIDKLRIRDSIDAASAGIASLKDMQKNLESELAEKREKKLDIVLAIIAILGVFQSIVAIIELFNMFGW